MEQPSVRILVQAFHQSVSESFRARQTAKSLMRIEVMPTCNQFRKMIQYADCTRNIQFSSTYFCINTNVYYCKFAVSYNPYLYVQYFTTRKYKPIQTLFFAITSAVFCCDLGPQHHQEMRHHIGPCDLQTIAFP